jgi:hypothetical protein
MKSVSLALAVPWAHLRIVQPPTCSDGIRLGKL